MAVRTEGILIRVTGVHNKIKTIDLPSSPLLSGLQLILAQFIVTPKG